MGRSQTVTHFIVTTWNDGEKTRYGWHRRNGKPTRANLAKLVKGQEGEFSRTQLIHADSTVIATIEGK